MSATHRHVYILCAAHDDYTQGDEIHGVYTSERKAKAAARDLAGVSRLDWMASGSVKTHSRFTMLADGPTPEPLDRDSALGSENESPWHYAITVVRPE